MAFCGLFAVVDKHISTHLYGHFEHFYFFKQEIALIAGLARFSHRGFIAFERL